MPTWRGYAWAVAGVVFTTLLAGPWRPTLELVNIVMLYLLVVVIVAYLYGRGPATLAAICGVLAFDFFFVPPQFSFAVADMQYLLTFAVMLATGLVIAHLTERLRHELLQARQREQHSRSLYELARTLSGTLADEQIADAAKRYFARSFGADLHVLLLGGNGELKSVEETDPVSIAIDANVARAVLALETPTGERLPVVETGDLLYLPLKAPLRTRGVLVVKPGDRILLAGAERRFLLETYAVLIAIAIERVHFVSAAREATVHMESERLRSTLLSALSHDLRTPLTAILGSAESMRLNAPVLPSGHLALIDAVRDQARRTGELVENILDMARLESGAHLRREWQSLEEIIGSALSARALLLATHVVTVQLAADLPLIECDATLMERVFVNLLENAAKYTPTGSSIRITAQVEQKKLRIDVIDNGPGIEVGRETAIFEKFERGDAAAKISGLGLGLAICRAIVEVHGGAIRVERRFAPGAAFVFTLPLGNAPAIDTDSNGGNA
jgi:two-component system, OmpR family, sensor histidine kinase KdpD